MADKRKVKPAFVVDATKEQISAAITAAGGYSRADMDAYMKAAAPIMDAAMAALNIPPDCPVCGRSHRPNCIEKGAL